ncbi:MAG: ABC transporter permease subunit, partial [Verrucomicrobiota bacterium]
PCRPQTDANEPPGNRLNMAAPTGKGPPGGLGQALGISLIISALVAFPRWPSMTGFAPDEFLTNASRSLFLLLAVLVLILCFAFPLAVLLVRGLPPRLFHEVNRLQRGVPGLPLPLLAIFLLVSTLVLFPTPVVGEESLTIPGSLRWLDRIWHLVLPAIILSLPAIFLISHRLGLHLTHAREQGLHWPGRARGLSEKDLFYQTLLPHALARLRPTCRFLPPTLACGLLIVEPLCQRRGLGTLLVDSLHAESAVTTFVTLASLWILSLLLTALLNHLLPPSSPQKPTPGPGIPRFGEKAPPLSSSRLAALAFLTSLALFGNQAFLWLTQDLALSSVAQLLVAGLDLFAWVLGTLILLALITLVVRLLLVSLPGGRNLPPIPSPPWLALILVLGLRFGGNSLDLMLASALIGGLGLGVHLHRDDPMPRGLPWTNRLLSITVRSRLITLGRSTLPFLPLAASAEISGQILGLTHPPAFPNLGRQLSESWLQVIHGDGTVFVALLVGVAVIVFLKALTSVLDRALADRSTGPVPDRLDFF